MQIQLDGSRHWFDPAAYFHIFLRRPQIETHHLQANPFNYKLFFFLFLSVYDLLITKQRTSLNCLLFIPPTNTQMTNAQTAQTSKVKRGQHCGTLSICDYLSPLKCIQPFSLRLDIMFCPLLQNRDSWILAQNYCGRNKRQGIIKLLRV